MATITFFLAILLVLGTAISAGRGQANEGLQALCQSAGTCSECYVKHLECQWCADETAAWRQRRRCQHTFSEENQCALILNASSTLRITQNLPFSASVQVRPQRFSTQLRTDGSVTMEISISPARDYPLDLYYLMDHSYSMRYHLDAMKLLSSAIVESLNNLTRNYHIGYGSFVDKVAAPATRMGPDDQTVLNQCPDCKKPYLLHHAVALTGNGSKFVAAISDDVVSGNFDYPEGMLDAMVQVAVCREQVGWRKDSRRLLLVASNDVSKVSGRGRIQFGLTKPNSGSCHLDSDGVYLGLETDYPSISFSHHILKTENILPVIFSANSSVLVTGWYQTLVKMLPDLKPRITTLEGPNVLELIEGEVKRLVSTAQVVAFQQPGIGVQVSATCPDEGIPTIDPVTGFGYCTNMDFGKTARYSVTVTPTHCHLLRSTKPLVIRILGYGEVTVDVDGICQCACETNRTKNSIFCSGNGDSVCGACHCYSGFASSDELNPTCDCNLLDTSKCMAPGNMSRFNDDVCSGRGDCICQNCVCRQPDNTPINEPVYSGQYCECDNRHCPVSATGAVCGGNQQGVCACGQCVCKPGFTGTNCDCSLSSNICQPTPGGEICSGAGSCVCGECQCDAGFRGDQCQHCSNDLALCEQASQCLNCTEDMQGECLPGCPGHNLEFSLEENPSVDGMRMLQCASPVPLQLTPECSTALFYVALNASRVNRCIPDLMPFVVKPCREPKPVNYVAVSSSVSGVLFIIALSVGIGIKLYIRYLDRREYRRFQKELDRNRGKATHLNPIFKSANTTIVNPTFGRSDSGEGDDALDISDFSQSGSARVSPASSGNVFDAGATASERCSATSNPTVIPNVTNVKVRTTLRSGQTADEDVDDVLENFA
ncbi:integrin beta-1-like [Sycon ciliatum]|uniref:integrin beta-1-like n=1 Tax=Sycon ciliatum TaxID=27933 RepID=UPI0031F69FB6